MRNRQDHSIPKLDSAAQSLTRRCLVTATWLALPMLVACELSDPIKLERYEFSVLRVEFSPNGKTLVGSGAVEIRFWDVSTAKQIADLTLKAKPPATYSSDGYTLVAVTTEGDVGLWDTSSMRLKSVLGQEARPTILEFVPESDFLVTATERGWSLWDTKTHTLKFDRRIDDGVLSVAISPNGKHIAIGGTGGFVRLWQVENGELTNSIEVQNKKIYSVCFSSDGRTLASASADAYSSTVQLWDTGTLKQLRSIETEQTTTALAFSPKANLLASAELGNVARLWNSESGELVTSLKGHRYELHCVAFSPDGSLLATGAGKPDAPGELFLWQVTELMEADSGLKSQMQSKGVRRVN